MLVLGGLVNLEAEELQARVDGLLGKRLRVHRRPLRVDNWNSKLSDIDEVTLSQRETRTLSEKEALELLRSPEDGRPWDDRAKGLNAHFGGD